MIDFEEYYGDLLDIELRLKGELLKLDCSADYFKKLDKYYDWVEKRAKVIEERGLIFSHLFDFGLAGKFGWQVADFAEEFGFDNNRLWFEGFENGTRSFLDYPFVHRNVFEVVVRNEWFEKLYFLRNLSACIDLDGDDKWFRGMGEGKEVYDLYLKQFVDDLFLAIKKEKYGWRWYMDEGVRGAMFEEIDGEHSRVGVYKKKDEYLKKVLEDVVRKVRTKFIVKNSKGEVDEGEAGYAYDSSFSSRLAREQDLLDEWREKLNGLVRVPKLFYSSNAMTIERLDGKTLRELNDPNLVLEFASKIPELQRRVLDTRELVGEVNYEEDFSGILFWVDGYHEELFARLPFFSDLMVYWREKYFGSVCHGGLHSGNVNYDGRSFGVFDLELASWDVMQVDLFRTLVGFPYLSGEQVKQGVYNAYIDWEERREWIPAESYFRFVSAFHLRGLPLRIWAAKKLMLRGSEEKARKQLAILNDCLEKTEVFLGELPEFKSVPKLLRNAGRKVGFFSLDDYVEFKESLFSALNKSELKEIVTI